MKLDEFATRVLDAADAAGIDFMVVGAIAAGAYGVPRSTKDIDLLVAVHAGQELDLLRRHLSAVVVFDPQVMFDTLTWGRRHVAESTGSPPYRLEVFEVFDDPFVHAEFSRRRRVFVPMLARATWLPTAEDVVVQKLRWGRGKDLDDARDVLAVQGPESLDMDYIRGWCQQHGTAERLTAALQGTPPSHHNENGKELPSQ